MTNAQHAIDILRQALDKIDKDLDPTYQITEAIKFCEAAEDDVKIVMLVGLHLKTTVEDEKGVDLTKCPCCDGPADNGHDRCFPPNPYNCTKCEEAITHDVSPSGVVDLDAIEDELAEQIKREYPKNWRAVETGMLIGVRHLASTGRIRGEWRPISEAPRDGTEILGAVEYHPSYVKNAHHIHQVSWNLDAWRISGMRGAKAFVTHWMPLPASPGGE